MPAGAKPGERRGGRGKNTPNKKTIGEASARQQMRERAQDEIVKPTHYDSLDQMRIIAGTLARMADNEVASGKPDKKFAKELLEAAHRAYTNIAPYEHRRLATLEPAMETVIKPDGSVHVTISRTDSEL